MGGEGLVQFCPDGRPFWSAHTGVEALANNELEAAYTRSHVFLLEKASELLYKHSWNVQNVNDSTTLFVASPVHPFNNRLRIPKSFTSFLHASEDAKWTEMFQNHLLFPVTQRLDDSVDLSIAGPPPLADIFYLLQCLAPGMLLITSVDEIDDVGEAHITRALPCQVWIKNHEKTLVEVLGSTDRYQKLLGGESKGFEMELIGQDYESDSADGFQVY